MARIIPLALFLCFPAWGELAIEVELQRKACFENSGRDFGPVFSGTTATTTFQWYRGESGDVREPISGATSARISSADLLPDEKVWVRARDGDESIDSIAVAFAILRSAPLQIDLLSRDAITGNWNDSTSSHLAEDGSVALFGAPAANNLNFIFELPSKDRRPLLDFGMPVNGAARDISNDGRFLLFDHPEIFDAMEDEWLPLFTGEGAIPNAPNPLSVEQISSGGRYLLIRTLQGNLITNDLNGKVDLFLHDRQTETFAGLTRFADGSGNAQADVTHKAEISGENWVFFSHFFTDPLVPDETGNLYIHDISKGSLGVLNPVKGKGGHARFLDASSNGRFVLFFWNLAISALREEEPVIPENPQQILYVYDREEDSLSRVGLPFPAGFTREHTISDDGKAVSFIHWGGNLNEPYLARKISGEDLWAARRLIPLPLTSRDTTLLQMSDNGSRFLFGSRYWSELTPQYATGSPTDLVSSNVMFIDEFVVTRLPTFESWAERLPVEQRDEQADPDRDGITNFMEYLAGRSPTQADGELVKISSSGVAKYQERVQANMSFIPEVSDSLTADSWVTVPEENLARSTARDGFREITVTMPPGNTRFFRLRLP